MSDAVASRSFPRSSLIGAGAMVGLALLAAVAGRIAGTPTTIPPSTAVKIVELRFADNADGSITVLNASDNQPIQVVAPGTNGFLRATLRGLASERKLQSFGAQQPFRLTLWKDGRLSLQDPDTQRSVELEAFGETNAQVFGRILLDAKP
jgi:putative photosynthetic complex assembly protein